VGLGRGDLRRTASDILRATREMMSIV